MSGPILTTPPDFFFVGLLEGCGVQHKVSNTSRALARSELSCTTVKQQQLWWLLVNQLLTTVTCAMKLMVVILKTYTRFANSVCANADVCDGLVYSNVFISFTECAYTSLKCY
jgi:hypothetical protein